MPFFSMACLSSVAFTPSSLFTLTFSLALPATTSCPCCFSLPIASRPVCTATDRVRVNTPHPCTSHTVLLLLSLVSPYLCHTKQKYKPSALVFMPRKQAQAARHLQRARHPHTTLRPHGRGTSRAAHTPTGSAHICVTTPQP